jgi:hypothetical protein
MAAAMAIEGLKPSHPARARVTFWILFGLCSVVGIATNNIASVWPAASGVMVWLGSSPVTLFVLLLGLLLWIQKPWRRTVWEATRVAAPESDSDNEARLRRLEHNHANLRDKFIEMEPLNASLREVLPVLGSDPAASLRRLQLVAEVFEAREKIAVVDRLLNEAESRVPEPPLACPTLPHDRGPHTRAILRAQSEQRAPIWSLLQVTLRHHGFHVDDLDRRIEEATAKVQSQADYLVLLPEDEGLLWENGREKQAWYLEQARIEVQLQYLRELRASLAVPSDFLMKLAHLRVK